MKLLNIPLLILFGLLITLSTGYTKDADEIQRQGQERIKEIKAKGEARIREIKARYQKFLTGLKRYDRNADFTMPISVKRAANVTSHNLIPGMRDIPKVYAYAKTSQNLLSKPDSESRTIGVRLRKGMRVEVIFMLRVRSTAGQWCLVRVARGHEGFILNTHLQKYSPDKEKLAIYTQILYRGLKMQNAPGKRKKSIMKIPYRKEVLLLKRKSKWAQIEYLGTKGWVIGKHLRKKGMVKNTTLGAFIMPIEARIGSGFGNRIDPITKKPKSFHRGVDISAKKGTPILAAADGKVHRRHRAGGYGKLIVLKHVNGFYTYYAHQSRYKAAKGKKVKRGEVIGYVGNTGRSTGPHLHFEVRKGKKAVDPTKFIPY